MQQLYVTKSLSNKLY